MQSIQKILFRSFNLALLAGTLTACGGGSGEAVNTSTPSKPPVITLLAGQIYSGNKDGIGAEALFNSPGGLAADASGTIYITDFNAIRKITPTGVVTTFAGNTTNDSRGHADGLGSAATFNNPVGVAVDSNGIIYVTDTANYIIRKITPAGMVTTFAGNVNTYGATDGTGTAATFNVPLGIAVDNSGTLYVTDLNYTIRKITPLASVTTLAGIDGGYGFSDGTGADARFNSPSGIAVNTNGTVYVADSLNNTIRKITPTGVVTTFAGSPNKKGAANGKGSTAEFNSPRALTVTKDGTLYVIDAQNGSIRKITPDGVVTTAIGSDVISALVGFPPGTVTALGGIVALDNGKIAFTVTNAIYIATGL